MSTRRRCRKNKHDAKTLQPEDEKTDADIYHRLYAALRQHAAERAPHVGNVRFQIDSVIRDQYNPAMARTIAERGVLRDGSGAHVVRMAQSQCHGNTLVLMMLTGGRLDGEWGFALSDDGVWRMHSWAYDAERQRVVETTEPRVMYVGRPFIENADLSRALENLRAALLGTNNNA